MFIVLLSGCDGRGDELQSAHQVERAVDSASTLGIDGAGRFWIGRTTGAVALGASGGVMARSSSPGSAPLELIGETGSGLLFRTGDTLVAIAPATGERSGARAGFGGVPVLTDVRGRFVYQGAGSGAVLGFDPATLDPVWGWAARGERTTALAAAPEGDVVWQALAGDEGGGRILERDVQTGRVLIELEVDEPVHALASATGGELIAAMGDGARVELLRLRSRAGELSRVWRTPVRLEGEGELRMLHAPGGRGVAVFRVGSGAGVRVLDAEAGTPLGSVRATPLDAALGPDGTLYLLRSDGIWRVRLPAP